MEFTLTVVGLLAMADSLVGDALPPWFEFIKATGYLGLVFFLICIERPRQDKRQDEQAAAHRTEVIAVMHQIADDIKNECRN